MHPALLLISLAFHQAPSDEITLRLFQGSFVIRQGKKVERAPLQLPVPKLPLFVSFRKNKSYAVWDDRGLTVRFGGRSFTTRLEEIAVSPRLFAKTEIKRTVALIKSGKRTKAASALSGARRIGASVYFLVRWNDADGTPWLEALVEVGLTSGDVHPHLIGRFSGVSLARAPIGDKLYTRGQSLAAIVRHGDVWGEAAYALRAKAFSFNPYGTRLETYLDGPGENGLFVEQTTYGALLGGSVDLKIRVRKELLESRGKLRFLDNRLPALALVAPEGVDAVRDTDTGAELRLPVSAAVRRAKAGVLVWSPFDVPKHATLYDPADWSVLAEWSKEARPSALQSARHQLVEVNLAP